jgi:hypothetical protein
VEEGEEKVLLHLCQEAPILLNLRTENKRSLCLYCNVREV